MRLDAASAQRMQTVQGHTVQTKFSTNRVASLLGSAFLCLIFLGYLVVTSGNEHSMRQPGMPFQIAFHLVSLIAIIGTLLLSFRLTDQRSYLAAIFCICVQLPLITLGIIYFHKTYML